MVTGHTMLVTIVGSQTRNFTPILLTYLASAHHPHRTPSRTLSPSLSTPSRVPHLPTHSPSPPHCSLRWCSDLHRCRALEPFLPSFLLPRLFPRSRSNVEAEQRWLLLPACPFSDSAQRRPGDSVALLRIPISPSLASARSSPWRSARTRRLARRRPAHRSPFPDRWRRRLEPPMQRRPPPARRGPQSRTDPVSTQPDLVFKVPDSSVSSLTQIYMS
jgi:hypothetical protein